MHHFVCMIWNIFVFLQNHLLLLSSSFWWNHEQCLFMFILKKFSQSVSPIKWRTFAMLPRQHFHWGVLMATGIVKLRQSSNDSSAICMSNALDPVPGQISIMTALFSEVITCDIFDLMLCSKLNNPSAWLSAQKQVFVNISMSLLFLILSLASES